MLTSILSTIALASAAFAAVTPGMSLDQRSVARRSLSGQATYGISRDSKQDITQGLYLTFGQYGGNVAGGACSFSTYTLPAGLYGTALSDSNWDTAGNCGGCAAVSYGGQTITAMIVDECPGCGSNHLDLFPDAFSALADQSLGVIDVTWDYVPCPDISGNIEIHMKSGVSEYWFSAQVVNAKRRTAKLEVSTDSGSTWTAATRTDYNFFEISSGVGASTAWIRATSHVGTTVVVKDVPMTSDAQVTATANYA